VVLKPGESDLLEMVFLHKVDKTIPPFLNMDGLPGGSLDIWDPIDATSLSMLTIGIQAASPVTISLADIFATGSYSTAAQVASRTDFFPFIDVYGQYKHSDWPGKIHTDADLEENLKNEKRQLSMLREPENLDQYGGWKNGPGQKATGNFYVKKVNGKWWLVDPEGNLFWSHGLNCVGFGSGSTLITGRENYFTKLQDGTTRFNFYTANLAKKFGTTWQAGANDLIHKRLKSWGINTIANWSDANIYMAQADRIPYTANISYRCAALDGASFKFPDVFDPQFKVTLEAGIKRSTAKTVNDPYCIGYFIDNELYLGNYDDFTNVVMKQKPDGFAKKALIEYLKRQYSGIENLNSAYKTNYASWELLANETSIPKTAGKDIEAFNKIIIDKYYTTCSTAMKEGVPQKLYLGNRFNLYRIYYPENKLINYVLSTAAKYCDIVSINYYRYTCEELILPDGIDKPILIGEFHFGALDRGLPHTGLRNVASQKQRATIYQYYVSQALHNPQVVGTHWFQYGDEPYTGRSDGENYQIGFVDICDTPYPETIEAVRNIGYNMYGIRNMK
jgi:hypothetical protein